MTIENCGTCRYHDDGRSCSILGTLACLTETTNCRAWQEKYDLVLRNPRTVLTLKGNEVNIDDLRDKDNEPAAYNKTRRGLAKAVDAVKAAWTETTTMYEAIDILWQHGIRMHSYCKMD
jgi:hypothetical protein